MDPSKDEKDLLRDLPINGVVKRDGIKYITELDETKTRIIDRYRVGKQIGKVKGYGGILSSRVGSLSFTS